MTLEESVQRRRGIVASRARLTRALTDAGLKTQAALAERIADLEGLATPPRDAVGRAFRETPVDSQTLERISRALSVDAYTLYKTSEENRIFAPPVAASGPPPVRGRRLAVAGGVLLAVIAVFALAWIGAERMRDTGPGDVAPVALGLGTPTLVVMPVDGGDGDAVATELRASLGNIFRVSTDSAEVLANDLTPAEVAARLRADVVVDANLHTVGRLTGVRAYLSAAGMRQQIWAESLPKATVRDAAGRIASHITEAVRRATGFPLPGPAQYFPLAPVQDDYLQGERYLDAPSNELNVKRAQSRFESALRQDANYARAHAGLCQALLEEFWMADEERALQDAGRACGQALQLAPDDPVVAAAHAHFLHRTGRIDEAIARYEDIVTAWPDDGDAWSGLANSRLDAYRQNGDEALLDAAKNAAQRASEVDPVIWKPLFALGTMEWFGGDVAAAIRATEAARRRDENEYVLANLGSYYLCDGNYDLAIEAYRRARAIAPGSYVGDEFLGQAYYFAGDFEASAEMRQRAIDSISDGAPEIHEMWGNLGDSYRQLGKTQLAIDAYMKAAEIAERDYLRGTAPAADAAARAYYYTTLATLAPDLVSDSVRARIDDNIDEIEQTMTSSSAWRRMAQTRLLRGEVGKARIALERATETCKGYAGLPDLAALAEQ